MGLVSVAVVGWRKSRRPCFVHYMVSTIGVGEGRRSGRGGGRLVDGEERPVGDAHFDRESMPVRSARRRTIECVRSHFLRVSEAGNVDPKDVDEALFMFKVGIPAGECADQWPKLPVGKS